MTEKSGFSYNEDGLPVWQSHLLIQSLISLVLHSLRHETGVEGEEVF